MAIEPENPINLVNRHNDGEIESETHRPLLRRQIVVYGFVRVEEDRKQMRAALAIGLSFAVLLLRKKFVVGTVDGGIFVLCAAMNLPLHTPDGGDNFKMIRGADLVLVVVCFLHLVGQGQVVDIERSINAEPAKKEANQVLIAFLRVHDAVVTGVTTMSEGAG